MDNNELAEKVMGWEWRRLDSGRGPEYSSFGGNWWYDDDIRTEHGSASTWSATGFGFNPLTDMNHAMMLLYKIDKDEGIEWKMVSNRRINEVAYQCTIHMYWEMDVSYQSGWYDTPQEAICAAAEMFAEKYG